MATLSRHIGIDVKGALLRGKKALKGLATDDNGRELSVHETRIWLLDELAKGHLRLPMGECTNWDYVTGCKGHIIPDPS